MVGNWKLRVFSRSLRLQTTMLLVAVMVLSPVLVSLSRQRRGHEVHVVTLERPLPRRNRVARSAVELIEALDAASRRAADGRNVTEEWSAATRARWHEEHSCASREEIYALYGGRRGAKWSAVLDAYAVLHRTCVQRMGDVDEFFLRRRRVDGCKFVVAGVSAGSGVGNKALSVVSALVYAVLTQRVLLVPSATAVQGSFCEPFEGSSWTADPGVRWSESKKRPRLWEPLESFYARVDARREPETAIGPVYAVSTTENWDAQPEPRFFCDTEQAQYAQVDWLNFRNNLYFVPKLFAVGSFRPLLNDLFPDRRVLTPLLRTALLPCNSVWTRVKQVHDAHFRHARRRIGVQERYFYGRADFERLHAATEASVLDCLTTTGLLSPPRNVTTVFITSLYPELFRRLTDRYGPGDAVTLVQLSHENRQNFGVEVDRQALTEILCLSLADHLIATPQSTFGALAQGYGGLVPWLIDLRPHTATPCVRALSAEPCYHLPATKLFTCPHDVAVNGQLITDVVPHLSDCHPVEHPPANFPGTHLGMQLITTI